jgi:hypothetical protein
LPSLFYRILFFWTSKLKLSTFGLVWIFSHSPYSHYFSPIPICYRWRSPRRQHHFIILSWAIITWFCNKRWQNYKTLLLVSTQK